MLQPREVHADAQPREVGVTDVQVRHVHEVRLGRVRARREEPRAEVVRVAPRREINACVGEAIGQSNVLPVKRNVEREARVKSDDGKSPQGTARATRTGSYGKRSHRRRHPDDARADDDVPGRAVRLVVLRLHEREVADLAAVVADGRGGGLGGERVDVGVVAPGEADHNAPEGRGRVRAKRSEAKRVGVEFKGASDGVERRRVGASGGSKAARGARRDAPGGRSPSARIGRKSLRNEVHDANAVVRGPVSAGTGQRGDRRGEEERA
eukprot:31073-Pelagococcus_subviridis.AAC.9